MERDADKGCFGFVNVSFQNCFLFIDTPSCNYTIFHARFGSVVLHFTARNLVSSISSTFLIITEVNLTCEYRWKFSM